MQFLMNLENAITFYINSVTENTEILKGFGIGFLSIKFDKWNYAIFNESLKCHNFLNKLGNRKYRNLEGVWDWVPFYKVR